MNTVKSVIFELSALEGGEEAALFAGDLLRMYFRWADAHDYRYKFLACIESEFGGFKEAVFAFEGDEVCRRLQYESGKHCTRRVALLDASGSIRRSIVSVAVMPDEDDFEISDSDLRVEAYRSFGASGQSVSGQYGSVRVTHLPTGIVVSSDGERSQKQNRDTAMRILRARLSNMGKQHGGKIRTYDFVGDCVIDHRIDGVIHGINAAMDGDLDGLFEALAVSVTK